MAEHLLLRAAGRKILAPPLASLLGPKFEPLLHEVFNFSGMQVRVGHCLPLPSGTAGLLMLGGQGCLRIVSLTSVAVVHLACICCRLTWKSCYLLAVGLVKQPVNQRLSSLRGKASHGCVLHGAADAWAHPTYLWRP